MTTGPSSGALELRERGGLRKHYLCDRVVNGSDLVELCFSSGWVLGRYEWDGEHAPRFHFTVELGHGDVWESSFALPDGARLRWPAGALGRAP